MIAMKGISDAAAGKGRMQAALCAAQGISAWLSRWTPAFISCVAVGAYFAPGVFGWVRGYAQTAVLGVIMLTMGMTLKAEDFRILASRPLDIAIGSLAQFTLMPLIAWMLVHVLGLPKPVGVGLVLVGCCPGGVSSNIMSFLCKGDVAFSVGMTTLSTMAAPLTTPLLMLWLAAVFLHNSLGYILGYAAGLAARFTKPKRRTVSIEVGMQNAGLATVLAGRHFPSMPEAAIASAVSCVWHSISGALLAGVFNLADALFSRDAADGATERR